MVNGLSFGILTANHLRSSGLAPAIIMFQLLLGHKTWPCG